MFSLQLSTLAGMALAAHSSSDTTMPVAFTQTTVLTRVPPPQVALHWRYSNYQFIPLFEMKLIHSVKTELSMET